MKRPLSIERVRALVLDGAVDAAELVEGLIHDHPEQAQAWAVRAYHRRQTNDLEGASADLSVAIKIEPHEPVYYFDRGRLRIRCGKLRDAVADFSAGLAECEEQDDEYYREALHFCRAFALILLHEPAAAFADLERVSDGFSLWIEGLQTKQDLMSRCSTG